MVAKQFPSLLRGNSAQIVVVVSEAVAVIVNETLKDDNDYDYDNGKVGPRFLVGWIEERNPTTLFPARLVLGFA